jgi:hypothetical protein
MATAYGSARKGTGPEIPEIDDDYYEAKIIKVEDSVSKYNGENQPQYQVTFEVDDERAPVKANGDPIELIGWIKIPDGVIHDGTLNENSKLYEFLIALGYDDENLEIVPDDWHNKRLRINVVNKTITEGENKGQKRARITGFKPLKGSGNRGAQRAEERRTTATAAPAGRSKPARNDDDDF